MFKITLPPSSRVQGVKYLAAASLDINSNKKYRASIFFLGHFSFKYLNDYEPL